MSILLQYTIHKVQVKSKADKYVSFLHAGVERLSKHKWVQPCPQLLSEGHNNIQVSFHLEIQVCL